MTVIHGTRVKATAALLNEMADEVANWTSEERAEVRDSLGDLATLYGTNGRPAFLRLAKTITLLRDVIEAVDELVLGHPIEKEG